MKNSLTLEEIRMSQFPFVQTFRWIKGRPPKSYKKAFFGVTAGPNVDLFTREGDMFRDYYFKQLIHPTSIAYWAPIPEVPELVSEDFQ